jgi:hypothetical protein
VRSVSVHILAADTGLQAHVIRAAAEHFGASVTVTWVGNSSQVVEFLSGRPSVDVIVLSFHGDERGLLLPSLAEECYHLYPYIEVIRPSDFAEFLDLTGSIVLNDACLGGTPEMAEAFLSHGASAYAGAADYPDAAASTKYVLDFLYGYAPISLGRGAVAPGGLGGGG